MSDKAKRGQRYGEIPDTQMLEEDKAKLLELTN